jgi:predicted transglutaminase-like cysteine proteinase
MSKAVTRLILAPVIIVGGVFAFEAATRADETRASFAPVGGATAIPYGWTDFCHRQPGECSQPVLPSIDIDATSKMWNIVDRINRQVNASIEPVSNLEHWGTILDHWDYPVDGKGDCKIYALYKRKLLIEEGFPRQALLMTIVKNLTGDGHTILTVKTNMGEFILDNLTNDIRLWNVTGYRFLTRQSQQDPNAWVSIDEPKLPRLYGVR